LEIINRYISECLTSDEEHDEFVANWVSVDCTAIQSFVFHPHFTHLQVPLLDVGSDQSEARVVDDSTILVGQRKRLLVKPRHLQRTSSHSAGDIMLVITGMIDWMPTSKDVGTLVLT